MTGNDLLGLLPLLLIVLFFFLFVIRPARARQREAMQLQSRLAPGQHVMTTSGMFATVVAVEDDAVLLEIGPGVTCRWARPAIGRILDGDRGGPGVGEV